MTSCVNVIFTLTSNAEAEVAAAKGRAHRRAGSRSSLGSELEAFSPVEPEIGLQCHTYSLSPLGS